MSNTWIDEVSFSGQIEFVKPNVSAAFILCFAFVTGRISPAKLNSPNTHIFEFIGKSVRAEYRAAVIAASMELSESLIPPATFTYRSWSEKTSPHRFSITAEILATLPESIFSL